MGITGCFLLSRAQRGMFQVLVVTSFLEAIPVLAYTSRHLCSENMFPTCAAVPYSTTLPCSPYLIPPSSRSLYGSIEKLFLRAVYANYEHFPFNGPPFHEFLVYIIQNKAYKALNRHKGQNNEQVPLHLMVNRKVILRGNK